MDWSQSPGMGFRNTLNSLKQRTVTLSSLKADTVTNPLKQTPKINSATDIKASHWCDSPSLTTYHTSAWFILMLSPNFLHSLHSACTHAGFLMQIPYAFLVHPLPPIHSSHWSTLKSSISLPQPPSKLTIRFIFQIHMNTWQNYWSTYSLNLFKKCKE